MAERGIRDRATMGSRTKLGGGPRCRDDSLALDRALGTLIRGWGPSATDTMDGDTFTIMLAADSHLGYLDRDPVRGGDSFAAFEEVPLGVLRPRRCSRDFDRKR